MSDADELSAIDAVDDSAALDMSVLHDVSIADVFVFHDAPHTAMEDANVDDDFDIFRGRSAPTLDIVFIGRALLGLGMPTGFVNYIVEV